MSKRRAVLIVVVVTLLLSALLLSQADAEVAVSNSFDAKVTAKLQTGGSVRTQRYPRWRLHRYIEEQIPRKYPFAYAPWESYLAIDKYITVGADRDAYKIVIDRKAYEQIKPIADENRKTAKRILKEIGAKGKGKTAVKKIRRYVRSGRYVLGIKSADGFFEHHAGDCMAHASAFYVLCRVQGIPVRICIGGLTSKSFHAWNKVRIGKRWFWIDETLHYEKTRWLWDDHKEPMDMW